MINVIVERDCNRDASKNKIPNNRHSRHEYHSALMIQAAPQGPGNFKDFETPELRDIGTSGLRFPAALRLS